MSDISSVFPISSDQQIFLCSVEHEMRSCMWHCHITTVTEGPTILPRNANPMQSSAENKIQRAGFDKCFIRDTDRVPLISNWETEFKRF